MWSLPCCPWWDRWEKRLARNNGMFYGIFCHCNDGVRAHCWSQTSMPLKEQLHEFSARFGVVDCLDRNSLWLVSLLRRSGPNPQSPKLIILQMASSKTPCPRVQAQISTFRSEVPILRNPLDNLVLPCHQNLFIHCQTLPKSWDSSSHPSNITWFASLDGLELSSQNADGSTKILGSSRGSR